MAEGREGCQGPTSRQLALLGSLTGLILQQPLSLVSSARFCKQGNSDLKGVEESSLRPRPKSQTEPGLQVELILVSKSSSSELGRQNPHVVPMVCSPCVWATL